MVQATMFSNPSSSHSTGNGRPNQRTTTSGKPGPTTVPTEKRHGMGVGTTGSADLVAGAPSEAPENGHVRLFGRIGRYFEMKETRNGTSLATFSIATSQPCQDQAGNRLKRTVWQRIVVWGAAAQLLSEKVQKGARVSVEGKLKTREWFDRGNNPHTTTELVARHVFFPDLSESVTAD